MDEKSRLAQGFITKVAHAIAKSQRGVLRNQDVNKLAELLAEKPMQMRALSLEDQGTILARLIQQDNQLRRKRGSKHEYHIASPMTQMAMLHEMADFTIIGFKGDPSKSFSALSPREFKAWEEETLEHEAEARGVFEGWAKLGIVEKVGEDKWRILDLEKLRDLIHMERVSTRKPKYHGRNKSGEVSKLS